MMCECPLVTFFWEVCKMTSKVIGSLFTCYLWIMLWMITINELNLNMCQRKSWLDGSAGTKRLRATRWMTHYSLYIVFIDDSIFTFTLSMALCFYRYRSTTPYRYRLILEITVAWIKTVISSYRHHFWWYYEYKTPKTMYFYESAGNIKMAKKRHYSQLSWFHYYFHIFILFLCRSTQIAQNISDTI